MTRRSTRRAPARIFAWPALLAIATIAALVSGLTGTGASDFFAVAGLALPVIVGLWAMFGRR